MFSIQFWTTIHKYQNYSCAILFLFKHLKFNERVLEKGIYDIFNQRIKPDFKFILGFWEIQSKSCHFYFIINTIVYILKSKIIQLKNYSYKNFVTKHLITESVCNI